MPVAQAQMRGTMRRPDIGERQANTLLIAAAPELLEACRLALAEIRCVTFEHVGNAPGILSAAIAKAEGDAEGAP